ncbi:Protein SFI1-like [Oopsacas minuta]|uniref:Protein SFI1-like n=1 Tax=Oopsacas minuta TaxID=111878 RepID=A0AAV7KF04_9METZ|nr:Protein SFI1-like [Oopsacas minuta]
MRFLTADLNYRISLQKNVFIIWKHFVVICRERREAKIFANNKYQIRITSICFYRMKQIFDRNQFIRRRCHELISLLGLTCIRKTFIAWKQYIVLAKEEHRVMLRAEEYCKIKVQLQAIRIWRENIEFVKMQKAREKLAEDFRNKYLINDCFQIWKFTQINVLERRFYEAERISKIRAIINKSCLARCFWGWLSLRDKTVIKRYDVMKANNHYYSCLTSRCVSQWKNAMVARKQFINMYQRACWFHLSSLLARTYTQWRLQLSLQRYYNHRHMLALWFWSRALERKVLLALRANARECRRKRGRYQRAADEFKERVVKKGILQIIHAGNVMLAADESNLMRNIERNTKYSWGCALKCAKIWKQRTISRKKNETREVRRCALAVPSLTSNIPRQHSGVDKFWSEITDFTVRGRALPAPRIPEFMKQTSNQISSSSDHIEIKPSSVCEVLTDAGPLMTSHTDIIASSQPYPKQREEMVKISYDDLKLLQTTKQQLIQVYESKLLLKSVREKLAQSQSENSLNSEGVVEIRNRVREITETIQRLESSIKHNIDSFTQHFSVPANI